MSFLLPAILSVVMIFEPDPVVIPSEPLQETIVQRWSDSTPIAGTTINLDDQGVSIRSSQQIIPLRVPWFDVKVIEPTPPAYPSMQAIADLAWRAHQRLVRGDFAGAELVYKQLEPRYLWGVGEQSVDVAQGLFLCRLDRGDRVGAITPAIAWLVAGVNASQTSPATQNDSPETYDQSFGLFTQLPPVFGPHDLGSIDLGDHLNNRPLRLGIIAELYQIALDTDQYKTQETGERLDSLIARSRDIRSQPAGVEFLLDMVMCQAHPEADRRQASRRQLENRFRSQKGTWGEAWARLAIGSSLIHEDDPTLNEQGVIQLIHIIVRMNRDQPELALLAAQIANEYLANTKRASWGQALIAQANRTS